MSYSFQNSKVNMVKKKILKTFSWATASSLVGAIENNNKEGLHLPFSSPLANISKACRVAAVQREKGQRDGREVAIITDIAWGNGARSNETVTKKVIFFSHSILFHNLQNLLSRW